MFEAAKRSEEARRSVQGPRPQPRERREPKVPTRALIASSAIIGFCWLAIGFANRHEGDHDRAPFAYYAVLAVVWFGVAAYRVHERRRFRRARRP